MQFAKEQCLMSRQCKVHATENVLWHTCYYSVCTVVQCTVGLEQLYTSWKEAVPESVCVCM